MKNRISTLLCLSLLLGLCGCNSVTPINVNESSLDEVSSSSTISSEERVPSITLSEHEVSLITDDSVTVSFKTKNYRGNVLVANSDSDVCKAKVEKKNLIIDGLREGTAVITLIAGDARDEITVTVEQRVVAFIQHDYSVQVTNGIWCPFQTNVEYQNFEVVIIDLDVPDAQIHMYTDIDVYQKAIYVECHVPCNFKVKISSYNAYDIASFNYYYVPWPEGASQYDGQPLVIRDENYEFPHVCAVLTPYSNGNIFYINVERGYSNTSGSILQSKAENGIYYFGEKMDDLNIESLPEWRHFIAIDFSTMDIWADFSMNWDPADALYGPNFEPYHLTPFTPVEDINFSPEQTYHVGETVTFVSSATNEDGDYYPSYKISCDMEGTASDYYDSLDIFNRSVVFNAPGVFRVTAVDELTKRGVQTLITVVE